MLIDDQNVQECDATEANSRTGAGNIKENGLIINLIEPFSIVKTRWLYCANEILT
jgi:hypothetical protein